jgi:hypothetical protein
MLAVHEKDVLLLDVHQLLMLSAETLTYLEKKCFPLIIFSLVLYPLTCPYHEFKHICYNNVSNFVFLFFLTLTFNKIKLYSFVFVLSWALFCPVYVCLRKF